MVSFNIGIFIPVNIELIGLCDVLDDHMLAGCIRVGGIPESVCEIE